ncbi:MAG: hypothetical protein BGO51_06595 [Rhodospirillales bacterium 69-11]|nr:hypothetical protein [Rhodospirillales bacterium]MBN8926173.1 hypothetical protein [Rhodospirillales bacterium]OJW24008.1 MAG: hypothetical protein BGO51_06595 [Rhodospirillales bacterium 69-11]
MPLSGFFPAGHSYGSLIRGSLTRGGSTRVGLSDGGPSRAGLPDGALTRAGLTRRASLLLPLALAACGGEEPENFPPLRYAYLPPIRLNVASIDIQQRFIPSGVAPDVTQYAPVRPADALRAMAEDRLQAFGTAGRAVFSIVDASLTRRRDVLDGSMAVMLDIYAADGQRAGYAEARIVRQHTGVDDLRRTLYEMVKAMMDAMNVEFEYQVRRALRGWLTSGTAAPVSVEQTPLGPPGSTPPVTSTPMTGAPMSGTPGAGFPPATSGTGVPTTSAPNTFAPASPYGTSPGVGTPAQMSPPPSYLTVPPAR